MKLKVTAREGKDESGEVTASTRVANSPPRLERVIIEPSRDIVAGMEIVARPEAHDADGDSVSFRYEWSVDGRRQREKGPVLSTRRLRRGNVVQVKIVALDGEGESEGLQSPDLPIVNSPPRIVSKPGASSLGGGFRYRVKAEDADGDRGLQFRLENAPNGMKVGTLNGMITWSPEPGQSGTHPVSVVVDDLQGGQSKQSFEVVVNIPEDSPAARSR